MTSVRIGDLPSAVKLSHEDDGRAFTDRGANDRDHEIPEKDLVFDSVLRCSVVQSDTLIGS